MDGIAHCGRVEETTLHFIEVIQRLIALATDVALRSCVAAGIWSQCYDYFTVDELLQDGGVRLCRVVSPRVAPDTGRHACFGRTPPLSNIRCCIQSIK